MLALLAEGMMSDAAEVAAWVSVVVVGMARKVAAVDRDAVRSAALRLLMRVASESPFSPPAPARDDDTIRRLIASGASGRDIRNALGCSHDELIAALWRIAN